MASINLQGDTSGSISISAPSVAGSNTLTLPATTQTLATQNSLGVRNLIINGDMRIDQRNAGASVTPTDGQYNVDRWNTYVSQSSKFTIQQNAGSVTPPAGFTNYIGVTSSSSYSVVSGDFFLIAQSIEGYNTAHLNWGTANAKTVTLSFWVRSSLTGTFGGSIQNNGQTRSYPFTYTISAADTWEQKSITITGDTTGTWLTTNGRGIWLFIGLGNGTTYSGTAGSWSGNNYTGATGATSVVGTSGATFYITGVQLEVGDTATPFEHRPYDMELARCMRYTWKCNKFIGQARTSQNLYHMDVTYPVNMRAAPSVENSSFTVLSGSAGSVAVYNNTGSPTTNQSIYIYNGSNNWTTSTNVQLTAIFNAEL